MNAWWVINGLLILVGVFGAVYVYNEQTSQSEHALLWFTVWSAMAIVGLLSSGLKLMVDAFI